MYDSIVFNFVFYLIITIYSNKINDIRIPNIYYTPNTFVIMCNHSIF